MKELLIENNRTGKKHLTNSTISVRTLSRALLLGNLGKQVVLKSEKVFSQIEYVDAEIVKSDIWYQKKENRDKKGQN